MTAKEWLEKEKQVIKDSLKIYNMWKSMEIEILTMGGTTMPCNSKKEKAASVEERKNNG